MIVIPIGTKFGQWTVTGEAESRKYGKDSRQCVAVVCSCGKISSQHLLHALRSGMSTKCKSCSAKHTLPVEIDKVYGQWRVTGRAPKSKNGSTRVNVVCSCGASGTRYLSSLISGRCYRCCKCASISRRKPEAYGLNNLICVYKNSAIKRKHTWNLSISAAKYLFESDCYYCGTAPNQISAPRSGSGDPNYAPNVFIYNGIDRIDNTEGYIDGNVVTCCGMCNTMKRHYSIDEFLAKVRAIYERHCKTAAAN